MKPSYSEFVRHCLRHYIKTLDEGKGGCPIFRTVAERENWMACRDVLNNFSDNDMDTISQIYRPGDTITDKIYMLSKIKRVPQDTIWSLINNIERRVARRRGLI